MGLKLIERLKPCFKDSRQIKYFMFIVTFSILSFLNHKYITQNLNLPQWLVVEIKTEKQIQIQIYYDIGEGYNERDKRIQEVSGDNGFQKVRIRLPGKSIHSFRVDPLTTPGIVYIKSIAIESLLGRNHIWTPEKIHNDFRPQNDISQFMLEGDILKVESIGIDPYFGCVSSIPIINRIGDGWIILILFTFSLICLLFYKVVMLIQEGWKTIRTPILSLRIKTSFIVVGTLLPIIIAIYFIKKNGLNVPFYDQWEFVPLLSAYFEGKPWIHFLTEFHNEHRIIFPRLIFLASAMATQWDVLIENYISLFFVCIALIIIMGLLKETKKPLITIVPISWIVFSLGQYENFIWGWQMQIFMMSSGILASISFLNKVKGNPYYLIPGVLSAWIASYSFFNGLLIWPIGFFQLYLLRAKRSTIMGWFIGGLLAITLYFSGDIKYADPTSQHDIFIFLRNPFDYIMYLLAYIGAIFSGGSVKQGVVYGSVIMIIFMFVVFQALHSRQWERSIPWVMISIFSLLSGIMIGVGRLGFGVDQALSSRYNSISLLFILATIALAVDVKIGKTLSHHIVMIVLPILLMLLITGFIDSYLSGWREGYHQKLILGQFSRSLQDVRNASDRELKMVYWNANILRDRATILKNLKLGPYAKDTK